MSVIEGSYQSNRLTDGISRMHSYIERPVRRSGRRIVGVRYTKPTWISSDGKVTVAYPARVGFRGFDDDSESSGFVGLTEHLKANIEEL